MTHKEQMDKIRDMADCADASYAMLDFVDGFINHSEWYEKEEIEYGDKQKLGDKFKDIKFNSTYARCIEARFMKDVVLEKGIFKDTTIDNNPINIPIDSTLSTSTKNFVNRYEIRFHQPNTDSGFSATLFQNK